MTKDNEMILRVLEAKLKKNDKEAFDYVSALGYELTKANGTYTVSKPCGSYYFYKYVDIDFWNDYGKDPRDYIIIRKEGGRTNRKVYRKDFDKIDFIALLEKPLNREYASILDEKRFGKESKYDHIRKNLKWKKSSVKCKQDDIERLKKQIALDMEKLEEAILEKGRREQELNEYRKEIGLK